LIFYKDEQSVRGHEQFDFCAFFNFKKWLIVAPLVYFGSLFNVFELFVLLNVILIHLLAYFQWIFDFFFKLITISEV
jgi:hypothetical protein